MVKISWKQKEVIEFSEADQAKILETIKKHSISEEKAIQKEIDRKIKHDIDVMASSGKWKLEKDGDEYYLDIFGAKLYYPGPDNKLSGSTEATGVALESLKKLLLKLSNYVVIKVVEGGKRLEYYKGEEELDPDLFDDEKVDEEEFL